MHSTQISNALLSLDRTLETPHLPSDHPLFAVLEGAFAKQGVQRRIQQAPKIYWGAERFKLNQSQLYQCLSIEEQNKILLRLTELNLSLSYFIEKSGHHYCSKMILLSDTVEEKTLYSLFAAEEASHLREFMNYMWFTPTLETHAHPMLPLLSEAIEWGSRPALVFVIQVLLEGFGIAHYTGLKASCLDADLKSSFQNILKDEARHHGAGLILTHAQNAVNQTRETKDQIFELSRKFIRSMETAHWIAGAFEQAGAPMSEVQTQKLWDEIGFKDTLVLRMQRLKEMFQKVNYQHLYERLQREDAFQVHSLDKFNRKFNCKFNRNSLKIA